MSELMPRLSCSRCSRKLSPPDGHTICLPLLDNRIGSWMLRDWPLVLLWYSLDLRLVHFVLVSVLPSPWTVRFTCFMIIIILSLLDLFCLSLVAGFLASSSSFSSSSSSLRRRHLFHLQSRFCMLPCNMFAFTLRCTENCFG